MPLFSSGTLVRQILSEDGPPHLILQVFLTHHLIALFQGERGSSVFTKRSWKQLQVQFGKELTSRLAWAVLLESSLHEMTTTQALTKRDCNRDIRGGPELKCTHVQLVLWSPASHNPLQPGYQKMNYWKT